MLTLKDLDGKPFPVSPDTQLNTRTGTVLIPNEIIQTASVGLTVLLNFLN